MRKHTSPFRRRSQHVGVLSDDMWMAHGRPLAGATAPHPSHHHNDGTEGSRDMASKTHYDATASHQVRRTWTGVACGVDVISGPTVTSDWAKVTCGNCLRIAGRTRAEKSDVR